MKVTQTALNNVYIIEPKVFGDNRGWFMESYSKVKLAQAGITCDFIQDNQSFSACKGTLRGLHFQLNPKSQGKLVRCTKGAILDVAVDIRKGSPLYKKWVAIELSAENKKQLFIPKGFAHGFLTLMDDVEVQYKADEYYSPEYDGNILYSDPEIGIEWGNGEFILSDKDKKAPLLKDRTDLNFDYQGENQ
ncbi:dTDP-4-dehydrorhamnose 3,5-epimerase [Pelosinus sp. IPA-1]|uniref:dTDP-4-dehydrorhamnose 3,5-epimerase n=1 Tax=Pelosinus sp. IPA-1 TaxID=3029569 RepID=UPI002436291C|nr:dTDP-4-dehydrorhamnose 3,5-epimerase [Pelosinus sp. IPA-1]GMB01263.1 dTDP-4-dehydrorhamnose 3,5-epimerase [Pelosinus sp. IPA-1]